MFDPCTILEARGYQAEGGGAGASYMLRSVVPFQGEHRAAMIAVSDGNGDMPGDQACCVAVFTFAEWEACGEPEVAFSFAGADADKLALTVQMAERHARAIAFGPRAGEGR